MSNRTEYFRKFPLTEYNGSPAIDILKRVTFNENVKDFLTVFYTHTIPLGERIEHIAHDYYDDVNYDWLIYHANDIVDPYYQVPLSLTDFDNYIVEKYKSISNAQRKTIHYKNNYESSQEILSTEAYNAKPANEKKYYQPVLGQFNVVGYERSETDFIVSTNKIETLDLVSVSGTFIKDEIVEKVNDTSTFAEISAANSSNIIIQHIRGNFSANTNYTIVGEESGATATVNAASFQVLQNVIPRNIGDDIPEDQQFNEQVYYSPVSFYDYEEQLNEQRREIFLVDNSYSSQLNEQLINLMR